MTPQSLLRRSILGCAAFLFPALSSSGRTADPLSVCATIPDLGNLAKEVGGDEVEVTVFAKGPQDPHFMEARPSFIVALSRAELFLQVGLDLEVGWVPRLQQSARNAKVLAGGVGFLDASSAVKPLGAPAGIVDRSLGDVHPLGNPHYLLDPVNGLNVARAIRDRLSELRPQRREYFHARYADFAKRLGGAFLGEKLVAKYDADKIVRLYEQGGLEAFLSSQKDERLLGGWVRRLAPFRGAPVAADHNLWPYFARRFGLEIMGYLEPKPGIAPTARHLSELVDAMKARKAKAIFAVVYFDPRHARFVAEHTGARVLELAHQCGSRPGTEEYIAMVEHNVSQIEKGLASPQGEAGKASGGEG